MRPSWPTGWPARQGDPNRGLGKQQFEQYVLAAYFESAVQAANGRLAGMDRRPVRALCRGRADGRGQSAGPGRAGQLHRQGAQREEPFGRDLSGGAGTGAGAFGRDQPVCGGACGPTPCLWTRGFGTLDEGGAWKGPFPPCTAWPQASGLWALSRRRAAAARRIEKQVVVTKTPAAATWSCGNCEAGKKGGEGDGRFQGVGLGAGDGRDLAGAQRGSFYYLAARWKGLGYRTLLDFGCGLGRHAVYFAKQGFKVSAFDLSDKAVASTERWAAEEKAADPRRSRRYALPALWGWRL